MGSILLSVLLDLIDGSAKRRIDAVQAFEASPANPEAQRYRAIAFCLFMTASMLLLVAAIVDLIFNARRVGEVFGWSGIVCIQLCVVCGIRYAAVNRRAANETGPDRTSRCT